MLKRNVSAVLPNLVENATGQVLTKKACKIQVPVRFSEIGLGQIGISTFTYGMFPVILLDTGEYTVCNVCAMLELNPFKTTKTMIDDVEYHEFYFEAGDVVIKTTDLVRRDELLFNVLDEFIFKGKIPWYVEYDDLGKIYDTAAHHAGSNIGQNLEVIEFLAAMISRSRKDRTRQIRWEGKEYRDFSLENIDYIPLKSVLYAVNSTVNKLAGSYFQEGIKSAMVNKSKKVDKLESILRA